MHTVMPSRRTTIRAGAAVAAAAGLLVPLTATGNAAQVPSASAAMAPSGIRTISSGWNNPWGVSWLPDGSALINERDSRKIFKVTRSGARTQVPTDVTAFRSGDSLLGIAVSPDWRQDHHVFVYHGAKDGIRVARMTYDGARLTGYKKLVTGIKRGLHNGGRIKFGPDGFLYVTTGDADKAGDAQDRNSLNGKILRMTKDGRPAPGNPFGTLVYSYGHRNPEGIAWDAQGRLWETEIGNSTFDELNRIRPGGNYGWPACEGTCAKAGLTDPERKWHPADAVPSGLAHADGALYAAALRGQRLWRVPVAGLHAGTPVAYYTKGFGRLRDVVKVPGRNALWITTDKAGKNADRVLQVELK